MKQFVLIALFLLMSFVSKGQTERKLIQYRVTISSGIPMSAPSAVPFMMEGAAFYSFSNRFGAGVGTGFSLYDKNVLIPLTGNLHFNLIKPTRFTPFLNCAIGYAFAPSQKVDGGLYLSPSVGVQMKILSGKKLLFALGYGMQDLKRLREYSNPLFISSYQESLSFHCLSIRLGFVF